MFRNKEDEKGFTLAELLIVVAIIAVLVAIAIPIFTKQLERSREATDLANCRSAYGELITAYAADGKANEVSVECTQTVRGWNYESGEIGSYISDGKYYKSASVSGLIMIHQYFDTSLPDNEAYNLTPESSDVGNGKIIYIKVSDEGAISVDIE